MTALCVIYIGFLISPPENDSFRKDLCFSSDVLFIFLSTRDLRDAWADRREILQDGQYWALFYNAGPKFQGPKTCKIWPDFGRLRSSAANISETDEDFQNRIIIPSTAIPPALGKTKTAKFGPVTLEI